MRFRVSFVDSWIVGRAFSIFVHVLNDDRFEPDERLSYRTTPRYMVVRTERKSGMGSVSVYDVLST